MRTTIECSGRVRVPLSPDAAIHLFTPEGERDWVDGWDPTYPAGGDLEPGLVFETPGTTWMVTHRAPREMAYARVVTGENAGTVAVRCEPDGDATVAHVSYRLTALAPEAAERLAGFEADYPRFMAEWEALIGAATARG
jgi:hypothetical protein